MLNPMRRSMLGALGGAAAVSMAGCCGRMLAAPIPAGLHTEDDIPLLVPMAAPRAAGAGEPVIDAHAHFFNASDASVAEFLTQSFGHMAPEYQDLLRQLEPLVQRLICLAPTAAEEYQELTAMARTMRQLSVGDIRTALQQKMLARSRETARAVWDEVRRDDQLLSTLRALLAQRHPARALDRAFVESAIDPFADADAASEAPALETSVSGLLNFVACMLRPRWHNLQQYRSRFDAENVVKVADVLVDFDGWYAPPALSPPEDQVRLHALIRRMSGGFTLPVVAFNPWSADSRSNIALVRYAVDTLGFAGVKLYPPMGFWPADNQDLPRYPGRRPADLAALDQRLGELFDFCANRNVPVLAHANSSMGPNEGADNYSGPRGWSKLLDRYAHAEKPPTIILGHFGGGSAEGKLTMDAPWPARFASLMEKPGGSGLYGDLGMWTELARCTPSCEAIDRLKSARLTAPILSDRLIYGSDWYMLIQQKDWWTFPATVRRTLGEHFPVRPVMHDNAAGVFGLAAQSPR